MRNVAKKWRRSSEGEKDRREREGEPSARKMRNNIIMAPRSRVAGDVVETGAFSVQSRSRTDLVIECHPIECQK